MLRHVVMFTWRPEATDEQKQTVVDNLRRLPSQIEALRSYHVGPDLGLADDNYDFAVVADVDDVDAFHAYRNHPAHQEVLQRDILPILDQRVAVQYEV